MSYPLTLLKHKEGNWMERVVKSKLQEEQARSEGYKPAEELWPVEKQVKQNG